MALRDAVADRFVLSRSRSDAGHDWQKLVFTREQLAALAPHARYTVDLIDAGHGGWGWVSMDTVSIPGVVAGGAKPARPSPASNE